MYSMLLSVSAPDQFSKGLKSKKIKKDDKDY